MLGKADWADRGTWIEGKNGREQVAEKPFTENGTTYIQTKDGNQYSVPAESHINFYATEDGADLILLREATRTPPEENEFGGFFSLFGAQRETH